MSFPPDVPLREQLRHQWESESTLNHFRKNKKLWFTVYVSASLVVAVIAGFKVRPAVDEIPLIVAAGFIYPLQYVSIYGFLWCWVVAYVTYGTIKEKAESRFVERERLRKPGQSFPVPGFFWRAFIPAALTFLVLAVGLLYVLFILPRYNETLGSTLSSLVPSGD